MAFDTPSVSLRDDDGGQILLRRRPRRGHLGGGLREDLGDGEVAIPLAIGRNDEPRCDIGRTAGQRIGVRSQVVVPAATRVEVAVRPLPVLRGVVEALLEATALLVAADGE